MKKSKARKANLYLNMILKWDEPTEMVKKCIDSIKEQVDGAYITITYNDDKFFDKVKTPQDLPLSKMLVKEYGAHISWFKWVDDFSAARNFAMAQVPKGATNFIYWQDADDVLDGAQYLHKVADMAIDENWAAVFFHYWYMVDLDEYGNVRNVVVDHVRERVIRNDGTFKWFGMLHEILIEQKTENTIKVSNSDCTVVHLHSDGKRMDKNIERNIAILEKQIVKENRKDPRTLIYLAKAYVDKGKMTNDQTLRKSHFDSALKIFYEYLEGWGKPGSPGYQEGSGWPQERATAWQYIGEIAVISNNLDAALGAYQNAIDEAPEYPNYYIDMAMIYAMMGKHNKASHWLSVAKSIEMPRTTIITTPRDMMTRANEVQFHVGIHTGELEKAREAVLALIKIYPENEVNKNRLKMIDDLIVANKASQSIVFLGKTLEQQGQKEKLAHLVQAIPDDLRQEKFASEMRHLFLPPKKWADNEIAILCGPGWEVWNPDSLKTGVGGSEAAVILLSQELKKLGWKVTVYANPGPKYGDYDGVNYYQYYDMNPKDEFNVLILWRSVGFVDFNPKSKFTMVWLHDVPNNPDFTDDRVSRVNKIAALSEYHKSLFRVSRHGVFEPMPSEKIFLTANGIPEIKVPKVKRDQYKMIYSSSPDRGLVYLLKMWPDIKKEVPQAKLDVYYGFEIFDKLYADNPGRQKWKKMILDMMNQDGIVYHGRVGREELHKAQAGAAIWAYPTDFTEISCITAMECQTLGAIPVCTTLAALSETVRNGLKIDVDITTEEGQEEYKKQLIRILKDKKLQEEIREPMMEWAPTHFGWDKVATQWNTLLKLAIQNPELSRKEGV